MIFLYSRDVSRSVRKNGLAFTASRLKAAHVYTMQAVGGMKIEDCCALGPKVGRTRGGLPRMIINEHRALIRMGDRTTIRFWLTLFSLYRVIE